MLTVPIIWPYIQYIPENSESNNPFASEILRNQMLVDDILDSSHSFVEATCDHDEIIHVMNSAGFSLSKWTSNKRGLIEDSLRSSTGFPKIKKLSDVSTAKTLGLRCNTSIYLQVSCSNVRFHKTFLLFDPVGWWAPKVIVAKILMQQI